MTLQFGDWKLVPVDARNFELCHRHVTKSGKNKGQVSWHRLGRYYSMASLNRALLYASSAEMSERDGGTSVDIHMALERWQAILDGFLMDLMTMLDSRETLTATDSGARGKASE